MHIPRSIKIGGHKFKIIQADLKDDNGSVDWDTNTISLHSKLPQSHKEAALIHEIFHVCNPTLDTQNDLGHALLDSLSEQFYQVLKDNNLLK